MKTKLYLSLLGIVSLFGFWFSIDIPNHEWYINDKIWLLNQQEKTDLENLAKDIESKTSAEISVLLLDTVDWDDINLVANEIWNKRWIWKKDTDNWIIILIAVNDRQWSIQVWYWLEWTIPDLIAKRVWEEKMTPNFQKWQYYLWLKEALQDISMYIQKDPYVMWTYDKNNLTWQFSDYFNEGNFFFILFFSFFIGRFIVKKEWDKKVVGKSWWIKFWIIWFILSVLFSLFAVTLIWVIFSFVLSYFFLILGVILNIYWKTVPWSWSIFPWWRSGGGGSFWGFGWGSFWWWWASGKW